MRENVVYERTEGSDPSKKLLEQGEIPESCQEAVNKILLAYLPLRNELNGNYDHRPAGKEVIIVGDHRIDVKFDPEVIYEWGELVGNLSNIGLGEYLSIVISLKD